MLEVPMQNRRRPQQLEILGVTAQRTAGQVERVGGGNQVFERRALDRNREPAAQRGHVGIEAMVAGDHGKAGEAAFGGFGLADEGEAEARQTKMEHIHTVAPKLCIKICQEIKYFTECGLDL